MILDSFLQYLQKVKHQIQYEILLGNSCTTQAWDFIRHKHFKGQSIPIPKAFPVSFQDWINI